MCCEAVRSAILAKGWLLVLKVPVVQTIQLLQYRTNAKNKHKKPIDTARIRIACGPYVYRLLVVRLYLYTRIHAVQGYPYKYDTTHPYTHGLCVSALIS